MLKIMQNDKGMNGRLTVLVTGCDGQLGSEIRKLAKSGDCSFCRFLFVDVNVLDICNRAEVHNYFKASHVDVVVNCAAYTAVDKAELEPEAAFAVNRDGVSVLSECCVEEGAFMIHVSTDYVFDGQGTVPYKESDPLNPTGVYGLSKKEGEDVVREKGVNGIIVRTAWLYSSTGRNFVKTMLRLGSEREQISVVADQHGTPTWAADLAAAILYILQHTDVKNARGLEVYHYTDEGECTWYEFASAIMQMAGKKCQVLPISSDEYPSSCRRPLYSVLDKSKIKERFGLKIPMWDESLQKMLDEFNLKEAWR